MLWLLLCIVFTSCLIISFKHFDLLQIRVLPAITFNYVTCTFLGWLLQQNSENATAYEWQPWMWLSILLGFAFIAVYYLLSRATIENGVTVGAIANKLSVVIPVIIAIRVYGESFSAFKGAGIFLAVLAVVLANIKSSGAGLKRASVLLPVVVFLGSGFSDSFLNYIQKFYLSSEDFGVFISMVFGSAFFLGIIGSLLMLYFRNHTFGWRDIGAGLLLGVANFGSMFTILKALESPNIEDSVVWAVNNVGVIIFASVYSQIVFREKLSFINKMGILTAISAIVLLTVFS